MRPTAILFDYGDTLVEQVAFDPTAGNEWLLGQAAYRPPNVGLEQVVARAKEVTDLVADRRGEAHIETPWPMLTRLIHDYFGIRFEMPMAELEKGFWRASVRTRPTPDVKDALTDLHDAGIRLGVVSNTGFSAEVIREDLAKHDLADYFDIVVVSSVYAVRKPNPLRFEIGAARLGVPVHEVWFVGDRLDTDVSGAKDSGMTAVWFNPKRQVDSSALADLSVADWGELCRHALGGRDA